MGVRQITSAQRLLLRLEDLGILERCYHPENRRKLILLRRTGDPLTPEEWAEMKKSAEARRESRRAPQDFGPDTSREMCQGTSKRRCQENKTKGEENRNVTMPSFPEKITSPPPAPAPAPLTPPAPPPPATPTPRMAQELPPTTPTASRAPQPVRPIRDELKALPGAEPSRVRSLAWRLAYHLKDVASIGFFIMVLGLVAKGLAPVERLLAAFVVADRSRGSARKPGAIFASTWNGWQAPPKPSEINRPVYYQATRPPEPPPSPEPEPTSRETISEEMLCDWETWASMPRHPLAGYAEDARRVPRGRAAPGRALVGGPPPGQRRPGGVGFHVPDVRVGAAAGEARLREL